MVLSSIEQILLITMIFFLMIGIGCSIEKDALKNIHTQKLNIGIGLFLQYISMPLITLILCNLTNLDSDTTSVLLLISCCPGGTTSNMFTYFSKANVELSITLTSITTTLAFLMTPLLLGIYGGNADTKIIVPLGQLIAILLSILFPIFLGLFIKRRSASLALKVESIGSKIGTLSIVIMIYIWRPKLYRILRVQDTTLFLTIGLITTILKCTIPSRIALAFETGIQNAPLAFAIITLSFPQELTIKYGWIPLVYGALSVATAISYCLIFRIYGVLSQTHKGIEA
jgi:predicted Na+-dependent transporter